MEVLIKKLKTRKDAMHPDAYLPSDYESVKSVYESNFVKPKVGESFTLIDHKTYFVSSQIVEILEYNETNGKFKTLNSIYYWEILK